LKNELQAPFPYFGGKSAVAAEVWDALGDVKHYIEPFFGSGAVLLARPGHDPARHVETVNDADGFLCNVWRALQFAPDETARWCDWPVNHACLTARKAELIRNKDRVLDNLTADPKWCDPVLAGYWIWAASCWIGHGLTRPGQRPHLGDAGMGVHKISQIPHLADAGKGVTEPYNANLYAWFRALSERLRYVRVVCGDWTRVCGGNWQDSMGTVGIFFDPPYGAAATRDPNLYQEESLTVAAEVADWALARGDKPTYRIVLAGYYEEHERLLAHGWAVHRWKAKGGYAHVSGTDDNPNCKREALFFSPHCQQQRDLL